MTLDEVIEYAKQLSLIDKVRLIEEIAPQIERELKASKAPPPRVPLRGLWKGLNITDEDIREARAETWRDFPRDNV